MKRSRVLILVICLSIVVLIGIYFVNKKENVVKPEKKIDSFVMQLNANNIIEKTNINDEILSILINEDDHYVSYFLDYKTGNEIKIDDLINASEKDNFNNKINTLLELKYPKFICNVLEEENITKTYYLSDNELVIYYDNYEMEPYIENLLLHVNYNEIYTYLKITVNLDSEYTNENGYDYNKNNKTIALTFDDGPNGEKTLSLLNILSDNKAKATFFMLGNKMNYYADVVKKVSTSGNEIGYHSYSHKNMKLQNISKIQSEYELTNQIYYDITGQELNLVRPPYGSVNKTIEESFSHPFILWSVDTNDWRYRDVDYLVNYVINNVNDGDIVLFHDSYNTSVEAVSKILPYLYQKGFQVTTVSELAILKGESLEPCEAYRYLR